MRKPRTFDVLEKAWDPNLTIPEIIAKTGICEGTVRAFVYERKKKYKKLRMRSVRRLDCDTIKRLWDPTKTIQQNALRLGLTFRTAKGLPSALGLKFVPKPKARLQEIKEKWSRPLTSEEAKSMFGFSSQTTAYNIARKLGLPVVHATKFNKHSAVRKVRRSGTRGYEISIPDGLARRLDWKDGTLILIRIRPDNRVILEKIKPEEAAQKMWEADQLYLDISKNMEQAALRREVARVEQLLKTSS